MAFETVASAWRAELEAREAALELEAAPYWLRAATAGASPEAASEAAETWAHRPTGGSERERQSWENGFRAALEALQAPEHTARCIAGVEKCH